MIVNEDRPGLREKIGYGFGDFASSMFWKLFSVYLLIFYTDVFGMAAAAAGTMFLVVRIWDAVTDPIVGIIADRTNTRWGKFRPYIAFGAIPFGLVGVLTFTTPDWSMEYKVLYAYVTYSLMMVAYTLVNVPYGSLLGVMSSHSEDRTTLASFRMVFAFAGGMVSLAMVEPLLAYFSTLGATEPNMQSGWMYTVMVYGLLCAILFYFTFAWTKERVQPPKEQKNSLKADLKNLAKNKHWFILLGAALSTLIFNSIRDGAAIYYIKYYLTVDSVDIFGVSFSLIATYLVLGQAANLAGVMLAKPVSSFLGKKNTFMYAMFLAAILSVSVFYYTETQVWLIIISQVLISICAGIIFPLLWAMYADTADYSEYTTGRRSTGLIFSSASFAQKMGWTLGGAMTGWTLAIYGYEANAEQTETAKEGIRMMVSYLPAAGALLSGVFIYFYNLTDGVIEDINQKLRKGITLKSDN
ncbi:MFS transporter [Colwellia sp. E2M01]|uniref:MFS transporter n=1 Tax=Colwellia sp. E2M01 TaxID=2841561 RepID=UPI001C08F53C|nr:MFS transporter [Colwellia sp. E2M01]MBU2870421.1 MFS transporter [Colwellia sp. E2M01]